MADNKTKPTESSVAAFIDALTDETRRVDAKCRWPDFRHVKSQMFYMA